MKLVILALVAMAGAPAFAQNAPAPSTPLSIDQAVKTALEQNPSVAAMLAEARAARAETGMARSMARPQVSVNSYLSAGNMQSILGSSPGVMPTNSALAPNSAFADQNVSLMTPLYTGGRIGSLIKAAEAREQAAQAGVTAEQTAMALMVREAYYRALLADEMVRVADARAEAARAMRGVTLAQLEAGRGIQASVQRAEAEAADAQQMAIAARNDREKMLVELKSLMTVPQETRFELTDSLTAAPLEADLSAAIAEAKRSRPEVVSARARIRAESAQADAVRGSQRPQVYGAAMADAFKMGREKADTGYTVGIVVSLPLLDGGQRRAEISRAESMRQKAEAELKQAELVAEREVRQAWLDLETAAAKRRSAESALRATEAAYEVMTIRVESGKSIQVEQLDALAAVTQARANAAQALYDQAVAAARLRRAMGRI